MGNISAKKYQNPLTCVKVRANQRWDFFETRCSSSHSQSQKSFSSFLQRNQADDTQGAWGNQLSPVTLPNVQHVATLRCDVPLIITQSCFRFFCSSDINISQSIAANSDAFEVWWSILLLHCSKFIAQPVGERILKICQILAKWKANI